MSTITNVGTGNAPDAVIEGDVVEVEGPAIWKPTGSGSNYVRSSQSDACRSGAMSVTAVHYFEGPPSSHRYLYWTYGATSGGVAFALLSTGYMSLTWSDGSSGFSCNSLVPVANFVDPNRWVEFKAQIDSSGENVSFFWRYESETWALLDERPGPASPHSKSTTGITYFPGFVGAGYDATAWRGAWTQTAITYGDPDSGTVDGIGVRASDIPTDPAAPSFESFTGHTINISRSATGPSTTIVPAGQTYAINADHTAAANKITVDEGIAGGSARFELTNTKITIPDEPALRIAQGRHLIARVIMPDWSIPGGSAAYRVVISKWGAGLANRDWALLVQNTGQLSFWSNNGTGAIYAGAGSVQSAGISVGDDVWLRASPTVGGTTEFFCHLDPGEENASPPPIADAGWVSLGVHATAFTTPAGGTEPISIGALGYTNQGGWGGEIKWVGLVEDNNSIPFAVTQEDLARASAAKLGDTDTFSVTGGFTATIVGDIPMTGEAPWVLATDQSAVLSWVGIPGNQTAAFPQLARVGTLDGAVNGLAIYKDANTDGVASWVRASATINAFTPIQAVGPNDKVGVIAVVDRPRGQLWNIIVRPDGTTSENFVTLPSTHPMMAQSGIASLDKCPSVTEMVALDKIDSWDTDMATNPHVNILKAYLAPAPNHLEELTERVTSVEAVQAGNAGQYASKAGDTLTGNLTVEKANPAVVSKSTSGDAHVRIDAASGANGLAVFYEDGVLKGYLIHRPTGVFQWVQPGHPAITFNDSNGRFDMTQSNAVMVPTPTGVHDAVKVVAWDAVTGRYAVQGPNGVLEQGDTGWRDVSSGLLAGWTATYIETRRQGNRVSIRFRGLTYSSGGSVAVLTLVSGMYMGPGRSSRYLVAGGTTVGQSTPTVRGMEISSVLYASTLLSNGWGEYSFDTNMAWPTSLPGVAL